MTEVESICLDGDFPEGFMTEWELFLSQDRPSGDTFNWGRIFPLQRQAEWKKMIDIANTIKPKVVMEIGSDKGGSVFEWCKGIPTINRMIAVEIRGTHYVPFLQKSFPNIQFLGLSESSLTSQCVEKVRNFLPGSKSHKTIKEGLIDILFIDGDKSFFRNDYDNYLPLMSRGGIVFFHDIQDQTTGNAFRDVASRGYNAQEIIDKTDWIESEKREKEGIPVTGAHEGWLRQWRGSSCGVGVIYLP